MRMILVLFLMYAASAMAGDLPDSALTPGVTRQVDQQTLCTTSTKLVRHTSQAVKDAVYKEYGATPKHDPACTGPGHSCDEIDHLISLEIGGADEKANLWPESYDSQPYNAHIKDKLENELHRRICAGAMTIQEAQTCIATDWVACYQKVMKP